MIIGQGTVCIIAPHGRFRSASAKTPLSKGVDTRRFTYVFPDYSGYGARVAETGEYTIEEIALDTLALVDKLG